MRGVCRMISKLLLVIERYLRYLAKISHRQQPRFMYYIICLLAYISIDSSGLLMGSHTLRKSEF